MINKQNIMDNKGSYGNFSKEEMEHYTEEARLRWGDTEAFKQSQERVQKMGKEGLRKVLAESGTLTREIAQSMNEGEDPTGERVQALILKHYEGLRAFYEPNLDIYLGLADIYVSDERFRANYENVAEGLAQFMHDAMMHFAKTREV